MSDRNKLSNMSGYEPTTSSNYLHAQKLIRSMDFDNKVIYVICGLCGIVALVNLLEII